jgi:PKD repeat protein
MKKRFLPALLISGAALFLLCGPNQSPYTNPADAKIVAGNSLRSLDAGSDSLKVFSAVQCTVELYLPKLIDSFYVHLSRNGSDSIIASGAVTGASFMFPLSVSVPGVYGLKVVVVKNDKSTDSLEKTITVYAMSPVVTPDAPVHTVFLPADSFSITFTVTDPDSNVWKAYTWLDSVSGATQEISFAPKTHSAVIMRTVKGSALLAALHAPVVCYAVAIDFPDSNVSKVAACTLHVKDTLAPRIVLLPPTDTVNPTSSPVTVKALVTDFVGVDSVTFNGTPMVFSNDTALFFATLDSGRHADSIVAIDKAGNKGKLLFTLAVQGKVRVPPQIKDLSRATSEGLPFDSIWLDTCVAIADTSIHDKPSYAKDSLSWMITDSAGVSIVAPPGHRIKIPFPADSAFWGTYKLTFKLYDKNITYLYDTKQPSFFVTQANFPPVITLYTDRCFRNFLADTINLNAATSVHDPNDPASSLTWTFTKGKHFKVDTLMSRGFGRLSKSAANSVVNPIDPIGGIILYPIYFNHHIVIDTISAADASFFGTDSIKFTVKDPAGTSVNKMIYFTRVNGFCLYHP